jgi:heme exporter protein C
MDGLMLFSLFFGVVVFTMMYVWLVLHRQRALALQDMIDDSGLDRAIAERRLEMSDHG